MASSKVERISISSSSATAEAVGEGSAASMKADLGASGQRAASSSPEIDGQLREVRILPAKKVSDDRRKESEQAHIGRERVDLFVVVLGVSRRGCVRQYSKLRNRATHRTRMVGLL